MESPEGDDEETPPPDPVQFERGLKKLYWSFGWKAAMGLLVFVVSFNLPFPSKWLNLPFILLGGWFLLTNLSSIAMLTRVQNAYRHGPEDDTPLAYQERGERVLHYAGIVLLFAAILVIKPLGRMVENIVEQMRWVLWSGGIGVMMAALVLWWAKQRFPLYYRNNEKRAASILGLFFGTVSLLVLVPAWIDRDSAEARIEVRRYALKHGGENITTGSTYLHLYHPGQAETTFRIQVRSKELEAAMGRDSVILRTGTGDLGFTHVLEVVGPSTATPDN